MCNLRDVVKYNLSLKSIFPLNETQAMNNELIILHAIKLREHTLKWIKFKIRFHTPDIKLAQRLALSGFNGVKSDLILILTLQRIVALYHMEQNSEAARGSTNWVCLLVRRLTINNYSVFDVIRMWPEADNYHNLITEPEESKPWVRAPPLATPYPVSSGASLTTLHWRLITRSAKVGQIQTNRGILGKNNFTLL